MLQEIVVKSPCSLYELLSKETDLGHFQILKVINNRNVKVNRARVGEDITLKEGDVVHVYMKDREKEAVEIAFSDKNILIAIKPQGIEVQGENSLQQRLENQLEDEKPVAVHRLDRNTMGLVLFALNKQTENEMLRVFKQREIDKKYLTIVTGNPKKGVNCVLKAYLFKDAKKSQVYISDVPKPGYQPIETHYKKIKQVGELSLLEVKLVTGRTHQIRAHLAHVNLPVLGDGKYGINAINKKYKVSKQLLVCHKISLHFDEKSPLHYLDNRTFTYDIDLFDFVTMPEKQNSNKD
jgi:23S rRNA pseudouridine955/2504/2580 synthase